MLTTPAPRFLLNMLKDPLDKAHAGDTVRFLRYGSLEAEREVDRQAEQARVTYEAAPKGVREIAWPRVWASREEIEQSGYTGFWRYSGKR